MNSKAIKQNSIWSYISKFSNMGLAFIFSVLLVRYLRPDDYGAYKIFLSIGTILNIVTSFGFESSITRFIPEFLQRKQNRNINQLLLRFLILRFCMVLLFSAATILYGGRFYKALNFTDIMIGYYPVFCLYLIFLGTTRVIGNTLFSAYMEIKVNAVLQIIRNIVMISILSIVILKDLRLMGIIYLLVITELINFIIYLILFLKRYFQNIKIPEPANPLEVKRISKYAFFSFLFAGTAIFKNTAIDNFVISHYLDMEQVGLYAFAVSLVLLLNSLNPGQILKPILNHIIIRKYTETKDTQILIYGNTLITKLCCFLMIPSFSFLCILGKPVVLYVYSPDYIGALPVLYVLASFFSLRSLIFGLGFIFSTLEKMHLRVISNTFSIYNLVMDIALVKYFGIVGVAFATGSALMLTFLYYFIVIRAHLKIKIEFPALALFKIIINAMIVISFLFFIKKQIGGIFSLAAIILFAFMLYFAMSFLNKPFNDRDRDHLNSIIGKKAWVF